MGLLDDLKQQAESQRQQEQSSQEQKLQNYQALHNALLAASHYFSELAGSLNTIKPQVLRTFFIEASSKLENLNQVEYAVRDYRTTVENADYLNEVLLRFRCVGQGLVLRKESQAMVKLLREHLWSHNLRFECNETKNDRGMVESAVFTVNGEVPATVSITGNRDNGMIRLRMKNVEKLGELDYQYEISEFTQEVLEEFAKLLLGKPNKFRTLGRHQQMMHTTTRPRVDLADIQYPQAPQPHDASDGPGKGSLLDNLKALIKK